MSNIQKAAAAVLALTITLVGSTLVTAPLTIALQPVFLSALRLSGAA